MAVVGGNLQGVEAAYLAKKAGWEVILLDRKAIVPAAGLCDRFEQVNITKETDLDSSFKSVDLIIPALENPEALACLHNWAQGSEVPLAFDPAAYSISSSKIKSDQLFIKKGVPAPRPWPECGFPAVAKPSFGSGSQGVKVFYDSKHLLAYLNGSTDDRVVQEYVHGPSYSIEVIGRPGMYLPLQVTDLQMDHNFDCKRVLAPTNLIQTLISDFKKISITLANELALKGLMDVEVILHDDILKVLEIDARLPSQTPTTVFWSTGINMLEMLAMLFLAEDKLSNAKINFQKGVVYEHIEVVSNVLTVAGEHAVSGADALHVQKNFYGADEALTNQAPHRQKWVATLIICGENRKTAWERRQQVIADIRKYFKLDVYRDSSPVKDGQECGCDPVD